MSKNPTARHKDRAKSKADDRVRHARELTCWQCSKPVAISERTGRPSKLCDVHLAVDRVRKQEKKGLGYVLPWHDEISEPSVVTRTEAGAIVPSGIQILRWRNEPSTNPLGLSDAKP
jgi:hypothetical protein